MTFADPRTLLWLLLALPLAGFATWAALASRARRERLFGDLRDRLAPGHSVGRRLLRDGLGVLAFAGALAALAGPQWGTWMREVRQRGVDVMVVLDTSRSMLARDVSPTRLERAKREVRGLFERLAGDRMGLVAFAGDARLVCPLTHDLGTLRLFLDDVDTLTNATGGTAIGEGLEVALDAFDDEGPAEKVILLLTDGEDHASDPTPTEIAYRALAAEVTIHVVAFGTAEGAPIRARDARGQEELVRDADGNVVITRPDEGLLEQVAGIADGAFLSAARTPFPLDEIWTKRIAVMEGVTRASSTREEPIDRYQWALVLSLLCLAARGVVRDGAAP